MRHQGVSAGDRLRGGCGDAGILLHWLFVDANEWLSVGAVEHVDPAGLAGFGDALAVHAVVDLIEEDHRAGAIEIPHVVMDHLVMPGIGAIQVKRHDGGAE